MTVPRTVRFVKGDPTDSAQTQTRECMFERLLPALWENPGRWAALRRLPRHRSHLLYGQKRTLQGRGLEAVTRREGHEWVLYARAPQ